MWHNYHLLGASKVVNEYMTRVARFGELFGAFLGFETYVSHAAKGPPAGPGVWTHPFEIGSTESSSYPFFLMSGCIPATGAKTRGTLRPTWLSRGGFVFRTRPHSSERTFDWNSGS